ncbi:SCO3374 family protein [Streptomyces sp. NBC_00193]|uniref:SCO3374 family protein n=1 Tax=Streptomyces sp. NBC_00193 TaxID=2975675 RepID=UPI00225428C3|nr:SCO3374 family protein [Streptomyces sp. NBC_00193]MCX5296752.1 SCO3374 family protein [Streptomyces sp. NBC_00193]
MALTAPPLTVPLPRVPIGSPPTGSATDAADAAEALASWYERLLGWPVAGGPPAQLVTGVRFDVLELPADAGTAVLRGPCGAATGPVALMGRRMRFLVAPGSADELEGLLDWLEWGGVALDLAALGTGGRITAPTPPGHLVGPGESPQGAAVWLRPPEQGCEALLPALPVAGQGSGPGRGAGAAGPGLVRLVAAAATECHRARLRRRTAAAHRIGTGNPTGGQPRFS